MVQTIKTGRGTKRLPERSARRMPAWQLLLVGAGIIALWAGLIATLIWKTRSDPWFPVVLVAFIIAGVLMVRYPVLERAFTAIFASYMTFCFWMLVAVAPAAITFWIAHKLEEQDRLWLQVSAFVVWTCLLGGATWFLATENRRTRLFDLLSPVGALAPLAYAVNVFLIALPLFGSLTGVLQSRGAIHLIGDPRRIMDFYLWHFLGAVPLLKVNETILWNQPMTYQEPQVGWLLLAFKVTVIIPVIGAFRGYWKYMQAKRSTL